jgi:hypothetical protein
MMPPLLAVLFFYFVKLLDKNDIVAFLYILAYLLVYEANYGYLTLSLLLYFLLLYYLLVPALQKNFKCKVCIYLLYVAFVYLGFWLYTIILHMIFWIPLPVFDTNVFFYILIEFLILALL